MVLPSFVKRTGTKTNCHTSKFRRTKMNDDQHFVLVLAHRRALHCWPSFFRSCLGQHQTSPRNLGRQTVLVCLRNWIAIAIKLPVLPLAGGLSGVSRSTVSNKLLRCGRRLIAICDFINDGLRGWQIGGSNKAVTLHVERFAPVTGATGFINCRHWFPPTL